MTAGRVNGALHDLYSHWSASSKHCHVGAGVCAEIIIIIFPAPCFAGTIQLLFELQVHPAGYLTVFPCCCRRSL